MTKQNEQYAKIFKALSDIKRLEIIGLLREKELCANTISEKLFLTQSGLSYHMKILVESGIVRARQDGKRVYYSLSEDGRDKAAAVVMEVATPSDCGEEICPCPEEYEEKGD